MTSTVPRRRSFVMQIVEHGQSKVNIRVPLGLAGAAMRVLPRKAQKYLVAYDIDVDQVLEHVGNIAGNGNLVHIEDGDNLVRIAIE